jgi:hypothetical protein
MRNINEDTITQAVLALNIHFNVSQRIRPWRH